MPANDVGMQSASIRPQAGSYGPNNGPWVECDEQSAGWGAVESYVCSPLFNILLILSILNRTPQHRPGLSRRVGRQGQGLGYQFFQCVQVGDDRLLARHIDLAQHQGAGFVGR